MANGTATAADANPTDSGSYDDEEYLDPTIYPSVGVQVADKPFDWRGLGDFISEVTPTAFGVASAATGRPINISGSTSSGQAISVSAGTSPVAATAGLGAAGMAPGQWSPLTVGLIAIGGFVLLFAVLK